MKQTIPNLEAMKSDPSRFFDSPIDVIEDARLDEGQKRELLEAWEFDSRELQIAEAEGLDGGESPRLREVAQARRLLEECSG